MTVATSGARAAAAALGGQGPVAIRALYQVGLRSERTREHSMRPVACTTWLFAEPTPQLASSFCAIGRVLVHLSLPRPLATSSPQLNELHNGLLMTCAADGAVRIWRNYAERGQQRLASAWQAVLVPPAGAAGLRPAVYNWSPGYSALFVAGGRSAGESWQLVTWMHTDRVKGN